MKRFISILLVAMLLVGCLSTVAFAETPEQTGSATFNVSGEFVNFSGTVSVKSPAVITKIDGITGNPANGMVAWAGSDNNAKTVSFTVYFKVPAGTTCGTYGASASISAKKNVYDDAGVKTGTEATTVSVTGGGSITIDHIWDAGVVQNPATCGAAGETLYTCTICSATRTETIAATGNHTWGEWIVDQEATCHGEGAQHRTCSVCNETENGVIPATGAHVWGPWVNTDPDVHWKECSNGGCTHTTTKEAHVFKWVIDKEATATSDGEKHEECICGRIRNEGTKIPATGGGSDPDDDDVVDMGDATPYGTYNMVVAAVLITLCGTVALVSKRKIVK